MADGQTYLAIFANFLVSPLKSKAAHNEPWLKKTEQSKLHKCK